MRIGFDAKKIARNFTGIGNYSRSLVNALTSFQPDVECHLMVPCAENPKAISRLTNISRLHFHHPAAHYLGPLRELWRCRTVASDIKALQIDLYHGLSNEIPFGINRVCKSVVTIHDLIFLRHPEIYGAMARRILRAKTRYACENAHRIVAISEQTKRDIIDFYHIDPQKITVVYQGCDEIFAQKVSESQIAEVMRHHNLPSDYILSVGTFEPRKNQISLIKALPHCPNAHLVLAGKPTPYLDTLRQCAQSLGVAERVHFICNVPQEHLPALYQGCKVFAYLSYFEGFGIPVLEAATSGAPILAATGSCLQEAGGDGQAYCVPFDVKQIAHEISDILSNPDRQQAMRQSALAHARNFTAPQIAKNMKAVYEEVLNEQ